jgi:hypothetical protein
MNNINEAVYPGNLGFMEFAKFQRTASEEQKLLMKDFIRQGDSQKVIELINAVTGVQLQPFQRNESLNRDIIFKR